MAKPPRSHFGDWVLIVLAIIVFLLGFAMAVGGGYLRALPDPHPATWYSG